MRKIIFQFSKNNYKIFSLAWNPCLPTAKNLLSEDFRIWKIWSFWAKILIGRRNLQITEKFIVLNFSEIWNTVSFEPKSLMKEEIYWLLKSSCFQLSDDGKYDLFVIQKSDGKMIFTWSFWAFHDIPGLGENVFFVQWSFNWVSYFVIVIYPYISY